MRHIALLTALCASLAGCATAKITTEYNPKADFASYKSYAWNNRGPGDEQAVSFRNPQVYAMDRQSVDQELAGRGLKRAEADVADLLVMVHAMAKDRIDVQSYGYAYASYGYYGMYATPVAVAPSVTQYTDGTLILDLVDARTRELAWRGTASDSVTDPNQIQSTVSAAVRQLLQEYPPKPGK